MKKARKDRPQAARPTLALRSLPEWETAHLLSTEEQDAEARFETTGSIRHYLRLADMAEYSPDS